MPTAGRQGTPTRGGRAQPQGARTRPAGASAGSAQRGAPAGARSADDESEESVWAQPDRERRGEPRGGASASGASIKTAPAGTGRGMRQRRPQREPRRHPETRPHGGDQCAKGAQRPQPRPQGAGRGKPPNTERGLPEQPFRGEGAGARPTPEARRETQRSAPTRAPAHTSKTN